MTAKVEIYPDGPGSVPAERPVVVGSRIGATAPWPVDTMVVFTLPNGAQIGVAITGEELWIASDTSPEITVRPIVGTAVAISAPPRGSVGKMVRDKLPKLRGVTVDGKVTVQRLLVVDPTIHTLSITRHEDEEPMLAHSRLPAELWLAGQLVREVNAGNTVGLAFDEDGFLHLRVGNAWADYVRVDGEFPEGVIAFRLLRYGPPNGPMTRYST